MLAIVLTITILAQCGYCDEFELKPDFAGTVGGDCADSTFGFLAGMSPALIISIEPKFRQPNSSDYVGILAHQWPAELDIQAKVVNASGQLLAAGPDVSQAITLTYEVTETMYAEERLWKEMGQAPVPNHLAPRFVVRFTLPEAYIGSRLCFSVNYANSRYGKLDPLQDVCIAVRRPCSAYDTMIVRTDFVRRAQTPERKLVIVDSLYALGWSSKIAFKEAIGAARKLKDYDRAIEYLDLCFQRHGSVSIFEGDATLDPAEKRAQYEQKRTQLVELRDQQQQR